MKKKHKETPLYLAFMGCGFAGEEDAIGFESEAEADKFCAKYQAYRVMRTSGNHTARSAFKILEG